MFAIHTSPELVDRLVEDISKRGQGMSCRRRGSAGGGTGGREAGVGGGLGGGCDLADPDRGPGGAREWCPDDFLERTKVAARQP